MKRIKKSLVIIAIILAVFIAVVFVVIKFIDGSSLVDGKSMEPTIENDDLLFYFPLFSPEISDVISFTCHSCKEKCGWEKNDWSLVKRIKEIDSDGCYWVEGDNKAVSCDSREFGWLCPGEDIHSIETVYFVLRGNNFYSVN